MTRKIKAVEVDPKIWQRAKGVAQLKGLKIGEAVDEALIQWIRSNKNLLENNHYET